MFLLELGFLRLPILFPRYRKIASCGTKIDYSKKPCSPATARLHLVVLK